MSNDRFIPTRGAIRLFDHYLTTLGETDLAGVRALIAADAARYAPERADDVLALFDRYLAYLADLESALATVRGRPLSDALAVTQTRQRLFFGDDADVLFGDDNTLASQLLARATGTGSSPSR